MKKIIALSDTHNRHKKINLPEGDIIIHAGDATGRGERKEIKAFLKWYGSLNYKFRIFIPGNHDFLFERNPTLAKEMCKDNNIICLMDESIMIDGIKIYGSPYTPYFYNWAFNAGRTIPEAAYYRKPFIGDIWNQIPEDTDILITHGPPYGIFDELVHIDGTPKGQFVGCNELLKTINRISPDLHLFGHIHAHGGKQIHKNNISYHNVSICDEKYEPTNPVTIIYYTK